MFPDAKDHIEVKQEEAVDAWTTLLENASQRKSKLNQAEHLQSYFDQYRHLMYVKIRASNVFLNPVEFRVVFFFSAWINETIAKITSPMLSQDVSGAEMLILRHQEHNAEINSRSEVLNEFYQTGRNLIQQVRVAKLIRHVVGLFRPGSLALIFSPGFRVISCRAKSKRKSKFLNRGIVS